MKREQIIEILNSYGSWNNYILGIHEADIINLVDAILALSLEVPSDEEIDKQVDDYFCFNSPMYVEGVKKGMKEMRDEIIKRNK